MSKLICNHLNRTTKSISLTDITFSLSQGSVLGIISDSSFEGDFLVETILKHPTQENELLLDNLDFSSNRDAIKQRIAFILKDCPFSMSLTANENAALYGHCYDSWNDDLFQENCHAFSVPQTTAVKQFSSDECIRFQLAFACAYDASVYVFAHATNDVSQDTKNLLYKTIEKLKFQNKIILFLGDAVSEYDQIVDYVLWLDKGKQVCFEPKDNLLQQFQVISGSEKQLRYIHETQPNLFLVTHILPNNGEALIHTLDKSTTLPLQLEHRTPLLHELVELQYEYYKANHSFFVGSKTPNNPMSQTTSETIPHKLVNTADAHTQKPSAPKKKQWNHIKWDEPKKHDDFWDQSDIEDSRTHKEHYENPFN